jgi:hypothetical protein
VGVLVGLASSAELKACELLLALSHNTAASTDPQTSSTLIALVSFKRGLPTAEKAYQTLQKKVGLD